MGVRDIVPKETFKVENEFSGSDLSFKMYFKWAEALISINTNKDD